jgi:class I fructose-bisphosphate aldolase
MLRDLGQVSSVANSWGMPVLAMVYARGPKVTDSFDPEVVAHCARAGEELGADVIKVNYTGSIETFQKVVDACCVPVVIAGGPKLDNREDLIRMASEAVQAGAAGLSIGRNIFQDHQPRHLVQALHQVVHEEASVQETMDFLTTMDKQSGASA